MGKKSNLKGLTNFAGEVGLILSAESAKENSGETIAALKKLFNENAGIEEKHSDVKELHSIVFNPSETDEFKVSRLCSIAQQKQSEIAGEAIEEKDEQEEA